MLGAALAFGCDSKPKAPPPPPPVRVAKPLVADVPRYTEWVGTLDGLVDAKITAQVTGYVRSLDYEQGSYVKRGDLLFTIDPRPFEAELARARGDLARAEARQSLSEITLQRNIPLLKGEYVSRQHLDTVRQDNEANLATVRAAGADVRNAQINLGFARIEAPIDGIAGIRQADVGDLVGPHGNVKVLTWVSKINPIYAIIPMPESQYIKVAPLLNQHDPEIAGEAVKNLELFLSDGSKWPYPGTYSFTNNSIDPDTGTIRIKATFPNADHLLRPGQFVRVRAVTSILKGAVLVPQRAVIDVQGTYSLHLLGPKSVVEARRVTPGPRVGSNWVIEKGLKPNETVIVEGGPRVRAGAVVKPEPYTPTTPEGNPACPPGSHGTAGAGSECRP